MALHCSRRLVLDPGLAAFLSSQEENIFVLIPFSGDWILSKDQRKAKGSLNIEPQGASYFM
jgi:hypothetical protein